MQVVAVPEGFTCWDFVTIKLPGATLGQFMDEFTKVLPDFSSPRLLTLSILNYQCIHLRPRLQVHHGAVIDFLSSGKFPIYSEAVPSQAEEMARRKSVPLLQLYEEVVGAPVFPADRDYIVFDATVEDADGETGVVPKIKFIFK